MLAEQIVACALARAVEQFDSSLAHVGAGCPGRRAGNEDGSLAFLRRRDNGSDPLARYMHSGPCFHDASRHRRSAVVILLVEPLYDQR